jgi:dinuclear metal center YbgI/SA1388 family protein
MKVNKMYINIMRIKDLEEIFENFAPNSFQESYDNSGLIIGNKEEEIKNILISLDVTEEIVNEAIKKGCNVIVSHHPILFFPIKRLNDNNYVERIIKLVIKNDISLYSIHTNLDNVIHGVSSKISEKLNLKNTNELKQNKICNSTSGMIGELENEINYKDFLNNLKDIFKTPSLKYTNPIKENIKKIAFCGGAGSFLLEGAIKKGADVFISSDFTYHKFFDADNKIMIIDIGHYEFEQFTTELIVQFLSSKGLKNNIFSTAINTNPVNYI